MRTIHIRDKKDQERFEVYQDLIILHSEYLHHRIRTARGEGAIVIDNMINITPALFTEFVPWINSGSFLPVDSTTPTQGLAVHWILLWQMGSDLQVRASLYKITY
jgi:hypothetical protein